MGKFSLGKSNKLRQLSPQDAQFLYMESEQNFTHVTNIQVFDPSTVPNKQVVRFKDIIAHVKSRMHVAPMLKQRLVRTPLEVDYPYWVDDEYFDLEYHMIHGRLPAPGDWRQFCIHMARYHSRPLDMKKPLWEMYVVEGLDNIEGLPKGSYAIATKIHHAAVDGASIVRFFSAIYDRDNAGTPVVEIPPNKNQSTPAPNIQQIISRATQNNLRSPMKFADTLMRSAPVVYRVANKALKSRGKSKTSVPHTRFNNSVSPHKMFNAIDFSLSSLKEIRALVTDSKINDVVLAICSGALRKYLVKHKELPSESLVAWVPINARSGGAADNRGEGNNVSAMTTQIHTQLEDPVERLKAITRSTRDSKQAKSGLSARLMTDMTRHAPAATQLLASRLVMNTDIAARACNLFVSNVPGPQHQVFMNGARLARTYGLAPLGDNMGLFIATPSFNGNIYFNVISTRDILPDIDFFMECLQSSHQELLTLVENKHQGKAKTNKSDKTK